MIYADYEFYKNEYCCGKKAVIDTASFSFYVRKSSQIIKAHTFDNIKEEIPECVKMCACEIAELLYKFDNINSDNGIISESVGDMSRSYESGEVRNQNLNRGIQSVIKAWLNDTGLLYRGAYD
ncbi:MAG: hypothetical protein J1F17_07595 [Oscillospiraceae bacterium]|nr:hypothetical protein [Oscillospiraceae bacterium]